VKLESKQTATAAPAPAATETAATETAATETAATETAATETAATETAPGFTCLAGRAKAMVVGHPHIKFVPAVQSVILVPRRGGLVVSYKFRSALQAAPEGVYYSWAVYIYRKRTDANQPTRVLELQVQDRGAGWEPTGWTILASTYYTSARVEGNIQTDKGRNELTAFFPAGFGNVSRPFYWFASQEEYRSYLPGSKGAPVDHNIYGSLTTDCPTGVRPDPNSLPYPAKLLLAGG
jgi:hypothetical protein